MQHTYFNFPKLDKILPSTLPFQSGLLGVVLLTGQWAYILGGISLSIIKQKQLYSIRSKL
jgi:hypothetical protein